MHGAIALAIASDLNSSHLHNARKSIDTSSLDKLCQQLFAGVFLKAQRTGKFHMHRSRMLSHNCLYLIFGTEWYSSFINSSNSLHGAISMKLEFLELKLHVKLKYCKLEFQKQ